MNFIKNIPKLSAVRKVSETQLFQTLGSFETLGSKFRNETEGLLPSPPPKTIIKKEKEKL